LDLEMSPATAERKARKRQKPPVAPSVDPATQYARKVVDGEIIAGLAVRLACQRHLTDLTRQRTQDFPYHFDVTAAQHILDFFPTFLTLESGEPFALMDWQMFVLGSVFGWKRADGYRRFQTAYVETGKGSGKTPMLAGVGLYGLAFDDEPNAEIYSAAFDQEQASIALNDAIRMARASDDLSEMFDIGKYNIAHLASGSFFRAMSSEHRSKSGQRPHMGLIDELHEQRDGVVVNKVRAGFKFRKQPLLFEITNSGHDRTSICWQHHQHSLSVLEGPLVDEQWFSYVCQLDPCQTCAGEGYRQPKEGCAECDSWTDPAVWVKANPSLGFTITADYLKTQVDLAVAMPSDQALVKRLNFCLWTESHTIWIPADRWDACKVPAVSQDNTALHPCAMGLDPSSLHDLTALVVAIRHDDPPSREPAPEVTIEGRDEYGQQVTLAYTLNYHVELIPFFWLPQETMLERVRTERIPYDVWHKQGHLMLTPGPAIDHHAVYAFALETWKRFKVQRLGMDENSGRHLFIRLRDDGKLGDKVLSVGQGKKLSEAFKFLELLVSHKRLRHAGNPVMDFCIANAEPVRDVRTKSLYLDHAAESRCIDGAVAAAMAVKELMTLPASRKKAVQVFVA
jgi:phage terminase large subunit-like protein